MNVGMHFLAKQRPFSISKAIGIGWIHIAGESKSLK